MKRSRIRRLVSNCLALGAGLATAFCARPNRARDTSPQVDTVLVLRGGGPSADFPQFPDSARRSDYRADPAAPACPTTSLADTSLWSLNTSQMGQPTVRAITVRLPPQYTSAFPHFPGLWSVSTGNQIPVASFHVWVGSGDRYPIAGIGPPPQQIDFRECHLRVSGIEMHVVLFTLQGGAKPRAYWVAAYGRIQDSLWMHASGHESETATLTDWLAVLRSIHLERP